MIRWLVTLPFLTIACAGVTAPTVALDHDFALAPNEAVRVEPVGALLRFLGVENDSRCPADALCIQGGDALVRIEVETGHRPVPYELHTGDMKPVEHEGLTIALVELQPYPFSARAIQPDDYRATLRVTGTSPPSRF